MAVLAQAAFRALRWLHRVHPGAGARCFGLARLAARREDGTLAWTTTDGLGFELDSRSHVDLMVALEALEPAIIRQVEAALVPGAWAIDLGANVGGVALRMARACGASGGVLAYEPNPRVAAQLRRNLELNGLTRAHVIEAAAGDRQDTVELLLPRHTNQGTASLFDRESNEGGARVSVSMEAVDERWRRLGAPPVRLIRLDIQGAELIALPGMRELLARDRPMVIMEHAPFLSDAAAWTLRDVAELLEFLGAFGYRWLSRMGVVGPHRACVGLARWSGDLLLA